MTYLSGLAPIVHVGHLFTYCWVLGVLCIFWLQVLCNICAWKISSVCDLSFHPLNSVLSFSPHPPCSHNRSFSGSRLWAKFLEVMPIKVCSPKLRPRDFSLLLDPPSASSNAAGLPCNCFYHFKAMQLGLWLNLSLQSPRRQLVLWTFFSYEFQKSHWFPACCSFFVFTVRMNESDSFQELIYILELKSQVWCIFYKKNMAFHVVST